jgi:hypothetical protein
MPNTAGATLVGSPIEISNQQDTPIARANQITADTTSFAGLLSSADDTVQKALETLDAGGTLSSSETAGATLSALRIVRVSLSTGKVIYASNDSANTVYGIIGMTSAAASEDDVVRIHQSGIIEDENWSWNLGGDQSLFLGVNGAIVQGYSAGTVTVKVGSVVSATKIHLKINEPIIA